MVLAIIIIIIAGRGGDGTVVLIVLPADNDDGVRSTFLSPMVCVYVLLCLELNHPTNQYGDGDNDNDDDDVFLFVLGWRLRQTIHREATVRYHRPRIGHRRR
uniref:Putative secreted protein n=1 Tax=Anopheles marajoara TaxID=58244 RepID=A0A2M4C8K8_9DIPT